MFLRLIGSVDVFALTASLWQKQRQPGALKADADGIARLILRDGRYQHPDLAKWTTVRKAIREASQILANQAPQFEITKAEIELLNPGSVLQWDKTESPGIAVHVAIVTNPGAVILNGNEGIHVQTGQVALTEQGVWHSAINMGLSQRVHLVLTLKKREIETDEP